MRPFLISGTLTRNLYICAGLKQLAIQIYVTQPAEASHKFCLNLAKPFAQINQIK